MNAREQITNIDVDIENQELFAFLDRKSECRAKIEQIIAEYGLAQITRQLAHIAWTTNQDAAIKLYQAGYKLED